MARPKSIPGLSLLLSQLPSDVGDGLTGLTDEQAYFYAVGWLRCAAERVSLAYTDPDSTPPVLSQGPVPGALPPAPPIPPSILRPSGSTEPSIGHWPPDVVAEVIGFAAANSVNPVLARSLAVQYLRDIDGTCQALPGRWAMTVLSKLEHPGEQSKSIRREIKPEDHPQDATGLTAKGEFGVLLADGQ